VSLRTMLIDQTIAALSPTQLVILGSGMDTRALAPNCPAQRRFEVDYGPTQVAKQEMVRAAGVVDERVVFVPVDFNSGESWLAALEAKGFDKQAKTVFVWEGVSYYLEPKGVDATLALVRECAPGSVIVFDYFTKGPSALHRAVRARPWACRPRALRRRRPSSHAHAGPVTATASFAPFADRARRRRDLPLRLAHTPLRIRRASALRHRHHGRRRVAARVGRCARAAPARHPSRGAKGHALWRRALGRGGLILMDACCIGRHSRWAAEAHLDRAPRACRQDCAPQ
jgi:hypothetical protein